MKTKSIFLTLLLLFIGSTTCFFSQNSILVISSATGNKKILQLNATDGTVINSSFIDLASQSPGTIKGIAQVGDKIWITDQTGDKIFIYDLAGNYVSTISTGLDNIRGINVVNNEVWVANDGSANGATADSIMRFSMTGAFLGFYVAPNTSIFDIVDDKNGIVYVSGLTNQGIQKLNYTGGSLGNLVASNIFQNLQQINLMNSGNLLAAVFQNHAGTGNVAGVYVISTTNGAVLNSWPSSGMRGVIELGDGNVLFTNDAGLYKLNTTTGVKTQILSGNLQFMTKALIPSLGVKDLVKSSSKIYPNPTVDFVQLDSDVNIEKLKVFAADGRLVISQEVHSKSYRLDVRNLPTGNYIIALESKHNTSKHRFIKK
ncbi:T9SS type A sorting domain-containing protein [Chryseobacterium oryctis]|uniref:T9SS type A sorting domain-containing protein n=1 Tax=Chryseobacterium oryctis TaxID=2952618 RepID=A0ABT3HMK3_9FLAO|nr:T9SS type A sorting domain-containing protein [Chryseobacterium oryctis]MCW3161011.1 T9SS type A sorting domain-containing protein [Chryseobacterium oryctis]